LLFMSTRMGRVEFMSTSVGYNKIYEYTNGRFGFMGTKMGTY